MKNRDEIISYAITTAAKSDFDFELLIWLSEHVHYDNELYRLLRKWCLTDERKRYVVELQIKARKKERTV